MVLGLGSKSRKAKERSLDVEFQICVLEINPWQGLKSVAPATSMVLQWKRGSKQSGNTKSVVPQVGAGSDFGKIVFNETFRLSTTLCRYSSRKSSSKPSAAGDTTFEEKRIDFDLYDGHAQSGQPLGRASLNLAPYAQIEGYETISIPLAVSKKVLTKGGMPNLSLRIGLSCENELSMPIASSASTPSFDSTHSQSSKQSVDASSTILHEHSQESLVAALLSEEEEIASFTDDEISLGSPPLESTVTQNAAAVIASGPSSEFLEQSLNSRIQQEAPAATGVVTRNSAAHASPVKAAATAAAAAYAPKRSLLSQDRGSSQASSSDLFSDPESPETEGFHSVSSYGVISELVGIKTTVVAGLESSYSMKDMQLANVHEAAVVGGQMEGTDVKGIAQETKNTFPVSKIQEQGKGMDVNTDLRGTEVHFSVSKLGEEMEGIHSKTCLSETESHFTKVLDDDLAIHSIMKQNEVRADVQKSMSNDENQIMQNSVIECSVVDNYKIKNPKEDQYPITMIGEETGFVRESCSPLYEANLDENAMNLNRAIDLTDKCSNAEVEMEMLNSIEPHRISVFNKKFDSFSRRENETLSVVEMKKSEETGLKLATNSFRKRIENNEGKNVEVNMKIAETEAEAKRKAEVEQLGMQVERLKGELLDVAAIEASLYSMVAEHGSSFQKVHSPARRLARLYLYACQHGNQGRRASSARNFASGLAIAARACGHDVPRLTYWWSNAVVLRETLSSAFNLFPSSSSGSNNNRSNLQIMRARKRAEVEPKLDGCTSQRHLFQSDWREPLTFIAALERLEAWIFSKVVESIWWQALMPHIQRSPESGWQENNNVVGSGEDKSNYLKIAERSLSTSELGDGNRAHVSIELWKKAFFNAFERLCPVRAVGVECGCVPILVKLVIEECVARLDVAMFNAILRESEDDVPTDPVSDPIADLQVLPIPIGTLSFGIGAQLKNAIYTISTWLTNLVSNECIGSAVEQSTEDTENNLISFPLLKATGDLLMLPKDILIDKSMRKEVLPALNLPLIKKILSTFTPDEFSPDPLSPSLFAAIDEESTIEKQLHGHMEDCSTLSQGIVVAPPIIYSIPLSAFVRQWIDDQNSSSRLAKSNSILGRGHTSDDELDDLESPFSWLVNSVGAMTGNRGNVSFVSEQTGICTDGTESLQDGTPKINQRFDLLREIRAV